MGMHWRQKLHLEPEQGWLNDPNGLCFYKGNYHVYFQYSPESAKGEGKKCWGHFISPDLLKWEFLGIVLEPDIPEDRDGVYSGSGIVKDDVLYLFYTGNVKEAGEHDYILSGRGANVIYVTTKDGQQMSKKKVVLRNQDYPDFCSCHVRDPKLWQENDRYYMVLGARTKDDQGCVLTYVSENLEDWQYENCYMIPGFGYMWECPDQFQINGKKYLGISPQGLEAEEFRFQNVYQAGYLEDGKFNEWDHGFDFYAPQTFDAPDGRRILIGWMGIGDIDYQNPTTELGWQHCLTLPREITVHSKGGLAQNPVRELRLLRKNEQTLQDGKEIKCKLPFELYAKVEGKFDLKMAGGLKIEYDDGIFALNFEDQKLGGGRTSRKLKAENIEDIRVIADTSSLEIYLDGGRYVLSSRFYPETEEIDIKVNGMNIKLFEL